MKIKLSLLFLVLCLSFQAKTYAVIVGVEKYDGSIRDLSACVEDAQRMYNLLAKDNSKENLILLTDAAATKQNILAAMQIFKKADTDDTVIFYFSGHGAPYLFCPQNLSGGKFALWHTEIKNAFRQSKAKIKLCFADACYSGSIKITKKPSISGQAVGGNVIIFMSSSKDQTSIESRNYNTGYFTSFLIKGLNGLADADKNQQVTAYELFRYVRDNVDRASRGKQTPEMFGKFDKNLVISQY